ncbi:MAG: hypothetical protein AAF420_06875 [Pseudomonadota bacterium]
MDGEVNTNEFGLVDMLGAVSKHRKPIAIGFVICFVPFVLYLLFAAKVYRAEAFFLPPLLKDIRSLNIEQVSGRVTNFQKHSEASVYREFLTQLQSRDARWSFFIENQNRIMEAAGTNLGNRYKTFGKYFDKKLVLDIPDELEPSLIKLTYDSTDRDETREILTTFIEFVFKSTVQDLIANVEIEKSTRLQRIREEIESKRKLASVRRDDRLTVLKEALDIARHLGIVERISVEDRLEFNIRRQQSSGVSSNTVDVPPYHRGSRALEAEIAVLENRESNDPFIPNLRELEEELIALNGITLNSEDVSPARIDLAAELVDAPVKPRGVIVLPLGIVSALFVVFVYLWLQHGIARVRSESS